MGEHRTLTGVNILTTLAALFKTLPYLMFYVGIGIRFGAGNSDELFAVARFVE